VLNMPATIDRETAFAELVRGYENEWIALVEKDGADFVVGSGATAVEAVNQAREHGYPEARLFKVPSFSVRMVA
jgi:hypothetical protein